jgi:GntR family transcriptional regulator
MLATRLAFHLEDLGGLSSVSRMPLYAQLADMMARRIRASQTKFAGYALPSEVETARHFGISRPTVRQAMSQLLNEGLIVRGRGRGTFVAPQQATRNLGRAFDFESLPDNHKVRFQLLGREQVNPDKTVRELFDLAPREPVERITRLRYVDGEIIALEVRYLPVDKSAKISDRMLNRDTGIIFVRGLIGDASGHVTFRVRAIAADAETARLIHVKKGTPLLSSEHTYYDRQGKAVLCGAVLFIGDCYDVKFQAPVPGI